MKLNQLKQRIEELDAKATRGSWYHDLNGHIAPCDGNEWLPTVLLLNNFDRESSEEQANLELAALSRTALPELLRRLLVAEEALTESRECLNGMVYSGPLQKSWMGRSRKSIKGSTAALATIRGEEE